MALLSIFILLQLGTLFVPPETNRTDDHLYLTEGELTVPVSLDRADAILTDYEHYRDWAFEGMAGELPGQNWHIARPYDTWYDPETRTLTIFFNLYLLGSVRSRNNHIRFTVTETSYSTEKRITFALADKNIFLRHAEYGVLYSGGETTRIRYWSSVRIAPLLDLFFTLKTYHTNISWYLIRIVSNFAVFAGAPPP